MNKIFILMQDIERCSQVPAQAIPGQADLFAITNNLAFTQRLIPTFHIINLAKRPAFLFNFQRVGCLIITRTIINKFSTAERHDQLVFFNNHVTFIILNRLLCPKQGAGKAGISDRHIGNNFPILHKLFSLSFSQLTCMVIANS